MAWVSPTGHNDPNSEWGSETNAYDGNTINCASCGAQAEGYYLELTHIALNCDKVRVYVSEFKGGDQDADINIDVFYSENWHNIFSGIIPAKTWTEKSIGSAESVTAMRICFNDVPGGGTGRIYETEFNEVETGLINGYSMQDGTKVEKFGYYMNSMEEFGYYMNSLI